MPNDKYVKQIPHLFHNQNHTRLKKAGALYTGDYNMLGETFSDGATPPFVYKNLSPGLYLFNDAKRYFMFDLPYALSGDDELVVINRANVYTTVNNKKRRLITYRMSSSVAAGSLNIMLQNKFIGIVDSNVITINDTIDGNLDMLTICGKTILSDTNPSPYNPIEITSISSFDVTSTGVSDTSTVTINLNNNIKSLPSGISDLFIMDAANKVSYIIYRIGRIILTGNEVWEKEEENSNYCTYFYKFNDASVGTDSTNISCNYFPSMTYSNMKDDKNSTYGICNSNNHNKPGFYIRIPTELITEPGVKNFEEYLRTLMKQKNPVIIEYLLDTTRYKSVILDNYDIKQYHPQTEVSLGVNTKAGYFYNTLNFQDN